MTEPSTILRKATNNLDKMAIVEDYAKGELSVGKLAKKYNTSPDNISLITKRFWKSLTNMRESRALIVPTTDSASSLRELRATPHFNEDFLSLLSESALLSDEEATYCWIYAHTGDIVEALQGSTLDIGLYREKGKSHRFNYDKAMILRGHYLNSKPSISSYIKELREVRLQDADIGKAKIQSELLLQLENMKASGNPKYRKDILRTIELLGKTIGAFTENIAIHNIDPANALDELIELAQVATTSKPDKTVEILS